MKRFFAAILMISTLLSLTACGGKKETPAASSESSEAPTYTVSITCDASPESVTGFCVTEFKRLVEEKTDGKITVNTYTDGAMGSDKEVMENLVSGQIEFAVMNAGNQTTDVPAANVLDMPCVFESAEIARAAWDDPEFRTLLDAAYAESGLKLLMLSDQSYRQTSSNVALRTSADFSGLDIRTMTNDVHIAFWKALGANPTPMNRSEVFLALQQNLLEAQEDPYVSIMLNNYAEVQDYLCETNHIFHNITLTANMNFFNSLPQEYQDAITSACEEILTSSRAMADEVVDSSIDSMVGAGMEFVQLEGDTFSWMSQVAEEQVWPLVREKAGSEIVDAMISAAENARS
jgi:tripartite ATP-independent transporter DctP family solute receptor